MSSPPPPAKRGLISGAIFAWLAALTLLAAPAEAQTTRTYTFTASVGGTDCTACSVNEGDSFTLTLTFSSAVTTGLAAWDSVVFGGTATAQEDYTGGGASGAYRASTFEPGDHLSRSDDYFIVDDNPAEPAETIIIPVPVITGSFGNTDTFTTTSVEITVTIAANEEGFDADRTLTVTGPSTIAEDDMAAGVESMNYTITLAGAAFSPVNTVVTWTVTHGTTADADFVAAADRSGTVSFAAADGDGSTKTFSLTIAGDDLNEAAETFSVQVSVADQVADGGTAYGAPARTTITDDDPITATLTTATVSANEGDTADFIVTLTGGEHTAPVVIRYDGDDATGMLSIPVGTTSDTLTLAATDDTVSEGQDTVTIDMNSLTATSAGTVTVAGSATLTINADSDDDITVTVTAPAAANTGQTAEFAVRMSNASAAAVTVAYTVALTVDGAAVTLPAGSVTPASQLSIPAGRTSGVISVAIPADVNVAQSGSLAVTLTSATAASGGGTAAVSMTMTESTATVAVTSDDPAARAARLEAPLASAGRGVGQLASQAVAGRLAAAVAGAAGASSLTIAGREFTGTEALAAEFLAGGYATGAREISADELLRQSGFNLAGGDGGRGFNFWGSGDFVSADGDHDGVDYDGDTSAFTLGIDTGWRDGLIGVAVSRSDGDVDFTSAGEDYTLETEVTSMHPYLTRRFNRSQLWLTAGHGSGDAEIKEPNDVVIKTDLTVTTAAFGITHARGDLFTGGLSALYSRAKLDAVTTGRRLPATTADSLRIKAESEVGWSLGSWSPFMSFALRHDSGDGDTGGAFDLGGGVEYQTPAVLVRLAGAGHIQGQGADEQRAMLTVRKSTGNFDLGLNLATDGNGVDTGRLLTGEWRF